MAEKKYSITDISRMLTEANPRFICLEDSAGQRIVPFNTKEAPFKAHLIKICSRLKAEVLQDGVYYVCFGESSMKGGAVTKIPYVKGEAAPLSDPGTISTGKQEPPMSQDKIIALIQENADLKAKVTGLELEIKYLNEDIKALEDEAAEAENAPPAPMFGLSEGVQNKIGDLATILITHFVTPKAAPLAEAPKQQPEITYEQILLILKQNPQVVDQLRSDLTPQPSTNGQHKEE